MNAERTPVRGPRSRFLILAIGLLCGLPASGPARGEAEAEAPAEPAKRAVPGLLMRPRFAGKTQLRWRNGETLEGKLSGADAGILTWKAKVFTEPMRLQGQVIQRLDFASSARSPKGTFSVVLTDGSHLTGDLTGVDDASVSIASARFGEIGVKRDQIVAIERIAGPGLLAAGPQALLQGSRILPVLRAAGSDPNEAAPSWFFAAGGQAASPSFNRTIDLPLDLPDTGEIELAVRTDGTPEFALTAVCGDATIGVETWDDEVVLTQGERFASAGSRFAGDVTSAHLRLTWDRSAGRCTLWGADGSKWTELALEVKAAKESAPNPVGIQTATSFRRRRSQPPPGSGIRLLNKGPNMLIERFRVGAWSGQPPPPRIGAAARVEVDGETIAGEPIALHGDTLGIRQADGAVREVPLASVRALRWPRSARLDRDPTITDLWFADGQLLRGRLLSVKDGRARVETAGVATPVIAGMERCRAIVLPDADPPAEPETSLEKLDVLTAARVTLHGRIGLTGGSLPHFQPVGAVAAVAPARARDLTLSRAKLPDATHEIAPSLLHVDTGESLPASLTGVHRGRIEFSWDPAERHEMRAARLQAVQFASPPASAMGFDGPGWQTVGAVGKPPERTGGTVTLAPTTGIGHPFILQGGDISFRMANNAGASSTLRVRLFSRGTDRNSDSINFIVADFGSQLYCGLEREEGQLQTQRSLPTGTEGALIRFTFSKDEVALAVNGVNVAQAKLKDRNRKKSGTGIVLEAASLWGNQVGPVALSDFSTQASPFMAGPPFFNDDSKREALLVPRLRRDDPPRHVLIGRNGDLLRGEIEAMTPSHFLFRSGLESFKVPVARVAAAVWVKKPENKLLKIIRLAEESTFGSQASEAESEEEADDDSVKGPLPRPTAVQWLDLTNGGRIALAVESWSESQVTGRHSLLGRCRIPTALVHRVSLSAPPPAGAHAALSDWRLENTADPVLPDDEGNASPLTGTPAADFELPLLEGGPFSLKKSRGTVVVLDFWATWCGPCVKSLPGLIDAMAAFAGDSVTFIAVNQGETKEQVEKFLNARSLKMAVAFDADQKVARKYGVDGIPHTVVIGRNGTIDHVKTGYSPDGATQIADAVRTALSKPAPPVEDTPAENTPAESKPPAVKLWDAVPKDDAAEDDAAEEEDAPEEDDPTR